MFPESLERTYKILNQRTCFSMFMRIIGKGKAYKPFTPSSSLSVILLLLYPIVNIKRFVFTNITPFFSVPNRFDIRVGLQGLSVAFLVHSHSLFSSRDVSRIGEIFPHSNSCTREIFMKCTVIVSYILI